MRVKICGITKLEQAIAIAELGAKTFGFICVKSSPRYVSPSVIQNMILQLPKEINKIGVVANITVPEILNLMTLGDLTGIQLHGDETPEFCQKLRQSLPNLEIIKALRVKNAESLTTLAAYEDYIDTFILDAYHPQLLGGTGKTINWHLLTQFHSQKPWLLAGGLTPDNILEALTTIKPDGIDLSSGLESAPGDKDLNKVKQLFDQIQKVI